jgi:hypothetical protein
LLNGHTSSSRLVTRLTNAAQWCNSILFNKGRLKIDKLPGWTESAGASMRLSPETSILKLKAGGEVRLREADFVRLYKAFFAAIEKKYL